MKGTNTQNYANFESPYSLSQPIKFAWDTFWTTWISHSADRDSDDAADSAANSRHVRLRPSGHAQSFPYASGMVPLGSERGAAGAPSRDGQERLDRLGITFAGSIHDYPRLATCSLPERVCLAGYKHGRR